MNEIEKMYSNAGIKKLLYCDICKAQEHALGLCAETKCEPFYPPFTAKKQIELIKWLGKSKNGFGVFNDGTEGLSCHCDFHWEWFRKDFYAEDFDNALAGLINNLWQDLTEEEKEDISGILRT